MLDSKLLSKDFYLNSLSMFFRDSFGIVDRMETYYNQLIGLNNFELGMFNRINIFSVDADGSPNYFDINNDINKQGTDTNILDKIAMIYGIYRQQRIQYVIPQSDASIATILNKQVLVTNDETITLKNYEMLLCIQLAIVENNYDGTYAALQQLYRYGFIDENSQVTKIYCAEDLKVRYEFTTPNDPLTCTIKLTTAPGLISNGFENIVKLFYAGKLTINSLGIIYTRTAFSNVYPGIFQNISSGSLVPTAMSRFYTNLYEEYPLLSQTVETAGTSYVITLQHIYGNILVVSVNNNILNNTQYTYNQTGKTITINISVSAGDLIMVRFANCQSYMNISETISTLELSQYDTMEITKVMVGSTGLETELLSSAYTFDTSTGVLTFTTPIAAGSNIYICCEPVYAVFY